jgi:prepilin-type N-terminal cleavage/methylation domain-containing protein
MGASKINDRGFTLIELSIVLVIIGLIVGGVLVGQDLIKASYIRATISQVEQFNTAVNTFYGKYGALPGDMNYSVAETYNFTLTDLVGNNRGSGTLGNGAGTGDGNGLIEGNGFGGAVGYPNTISQYAGEPAFFWSDMTYAHGMNINLIPWTLNDAYVAFICNSSSLGMMLAHFVNPVGNGWLPPARIGNANYFYVYSNGGVNYYGVSLITDLNHYPYISGAPGLTVSQAYNIDKKMDDGIANSGNVKSLYLGYSGNGAIVDSGSAAAGSYSNTTCYDSATGAYVTNYQGGNNLACALSFKFQ